MRSNLKLARHLSKLKQREVAKSVGISLRFYQDVESGHREGKAKLWDSLEDLFNKPQRELRANIACEILPQMKGEKNEYCSPN